MKKKVIFTSGKSDRVIERLKIITTEHLIISSDYEQLLSPDQIKSIQISFENTARDPNRLAKNIMYQTQRAFGTILTDGGEKLIVIDKTSITPEFLKMYENLSKEFHIAHCDTVTIEVTDENTAENASLKKDFFFIHGLEAGEFIQLIVKQDTSVFIPHADMDAINKKYLVAMTTSLLDLIVMENKNFTSDDSKAFKRFPPGQGYSVRSIELISEVPEEPVLENTLDQSLLLENHETQNVPYDNSEAAEQNLPTNWRKEKFWHNFILFDFRSEEKKAAELQAWLIELKLEEELSNDSGDELREV